MSNDLLQLKWVRPDTTEFPKVWRTFKAADLGSDELVEYRIEDLTEDRFEDALQHMLNNYLLDEPISEALNGSRDELHMADYVWFWRSAMQQKTTRVVYREGSDEIVAVNVIYVYIKGESFIKEFYEGCKSPITKKLVDLVFMAYDGFDPCDVYDVPEYLSSWGLSVDRRFRGRQIGTQLLDSRKEFCREFGLKISHTIFSSFFSIQSALRAGFKVDKTVRYDTMLDTHPEFANLDPIQTEVSLQTLIVDEENE